MEEIDGRKTKTDATSRPRGMSPRTHLDIFLAKAMIIFGSHDPDNIASRIPTMAIYSPPKSHKPHSLARVAVKCGPVNVKSKAGHLKPVLVVLSCIYSASVCIRFVVVVDNTLTHS